MRPPFVSAAFFLYVALSLGCGESMEDRLVGTWDCVPPERNLMTMTTTLEYTFGADGSAAVRVAGNPLLEIAETGSWTLKDSRIEIVDSESRERVVEMEIVQLTDAGLTLRDAGSESSPTMTCTRVARSGQ